MSSPLGELRALALLPLLLVLRMPGALPRPTPSGAVRLSQIRGTIGTTQLMEDFWDRRLLENDSKDEREGEMERMEIQEELPFLIDLNNIPDLVGADFHDHNPNIQVSIEVVENPTMDVEMDLQREGRHDWPLTGSGWPLSGPGAEDGTRILEWWSQWQDDDDNMAGSRKGGSQVANSNWEAIAEHRHVQPAEPAIQESWGPWSACTAACGLGEERRSRSCGPSCTATETQACQGPPCPGITSEDSIQKERFNKDNITYTAPDSCERWLSCNSTFLRSYISSAHSELPSCPCCYPAAVAYGSTQLPDTIGHPIRSQQLGREDGERRDGLWNRNGNSAWDGGNHKRLSQEGGSDLRWDNVGVRDGFRLKEVINTPGTDEPVRLFPWKDASSHKERLDVYHPTARYCIRSLIPPHAKTLAAQKCCYDEDMHLITRGPGAGIPSLVSPEFSPELHQRIDIAPWLACSGDWSRFHTARPPDNRRQCPTNPDSLRFLDLLQQAKDF